MSKAWALRNKRPAPASDDPGAPSSLLALVLVLPTVPSTAILTLLAGCLQLFAELEGPQSNGGVRRLV